MVRTFIVSSHGGTCSAYCQGCQFPCLSFSQLSYRSNKLGFWYSSIWHVSITSRLEEALSTCTDGFGACSCDALLLPRLSVWLMACAIGWMPEPATSFECECMHFPEAPCPTIRIVLDGSIIRKMTHYLG